MLLRLIIFCTKIALFFAAIGLFVAAYLIYYYGKDLPDYSQLKQYYPPSITRMYSSDGKLIEEYAREHRIFVPLDSIPKSLQEAFIAAEDKNFYHHSGIDFISIARAALTNVTNIINRRRVAGGSTITQQVVKNFLLTSEVSFERKIKEAILSYMITQTFTKEEILELYLNQIYLGKGAYGVAVAALHYFNKSVEELDLNESAVLASLPKAPSKYSPEKNYERAFQRKNYVLGRMYEDEYISELQARRAIQKPIILAKFDKVQTLDADCYASRVRQEVINMFGEEYFYTSGLTIMTCADSKFQKAATDSLRFGIKKYDMKRGYRGVLKNIPLDDWQNNLQLIPKPIGSLNYRLAIVLNVTQKQAEIGIKNGKTSSIFLKDMKWTATNLQSVSTILQTGDVILVEESGNHHILQQIPEVNGGIMVVEHSTGRVLASEGGYDFNASKFDRTTQAKRQPGSLIKPFVYLAALEDEARPNDLFDDAPIELDQGPNLPLWKPKNYEDNFLGEITMRKGLEKSRNTVTVRVGQFAGLNKVADTIKRFDINDNPMIVHSIVLGALETTLSKMVMAYSTIANNGQKVEPHYIEYIKDRKGNIIYKRDYTECSECLPLPSSNYDYATPPSISKLDNTIITDDASSYQLISMMVGGTQRGTSRGTKHIKRILAGKTGTTNDAKDAWFMGVTPKIVVGTYIGYDNPRSLGKYATGASIALPVFNHFIEEGYKNMPSIDFLVPKSVVLASVDYDTGKLSTGENSIIEAFKANYYNPMFDDLKKSMEPIKFDDSKILPPLSRKENAIDAKEIY